jgi:two-component system chemotaxis response regulator CheY
MPRPKILYVDDALSMRKLVHLVLQKTCDVTLAEHGQAALDALDKTRFDLIISDVNMPVMDGLTFLKAARERKDTHFTPILMMTTETGDDMKAQGRALGATGWLVKPFDPETLPKLIQKLI